LLQNYTRNKNTAGQKLSYGGRPHSAHLLLSVTEIIDDICDIRS